MNKAGKEFLVGCLVLLSILLMGVFAWLLGAFKPWTEGLNVHVLYDFAGGVEVGSPVRVAGIKVGRVDKIEFNAVSSSEEDKHAALRVTLSISSKAAPSVREDSRFYVNMAGLIGERYIEITPGSLGVPLLGSGSVVRGVDPPRIDQLLSQGYGVFGELMKILEKNEKDLTGFMSQLPTFFKDLTVFMKKKEWQKLFTLIDNLNGATDEVRLITQKFKNPRMQENVNKLNDLIDRVYKVDGDALKQFLQEDGIRARIF